MAGGNILETNLMTATLGGTDHSGVGTFTRSPVGHGTLLVYTYERRCDSYGDANGRPEDQRPTGKKAGDVGLRFAWLRGSFKRRLGHEWAMSPVVE